LAVTGNDPQLGNLGWQDFFQRQTKDKCLLQSPPVRVLEIRRSGLYVAGDGIEQVLAPRSDVTVGDWLLLDRAHSADSVLLVRKSLLKRRAPGKDLQVQLIAANIDTAFIVSSCNQDFNIARLERYIALVLEAEITPVILLTKPDLAAEAEGYVSDAARILPDVQVLSVNARSKAPREMLAPWCKPGQTIGFLGSSGVGKSTLTNALIGHSKIATQAIREDDARGRHTTTSRRIHLLPEGGLVMDTPGMRELQLTDAASGISGLFADLDDLAAQCKFRDCSHRAEPGCAVRAAVEAGAVDPERLARWRRLTEEEAINSASLSTRSGKGGPKGKAARKALRAKSGRRYNTP
jgi:ribosome biogenesis GTPase